MPGAYASCAAWGRGSGLAEIWTWSRSSCVCSTEAGHPWGSSSTCSSAPHDDGARLSPPNGPSRSEIEQRGAAQPVHRRPVAAQPLDVLEHRLVLFSLRDVQVVDGNAANHVAI